MLIDYHIHLERDAYYEHLRLREDIIAQYVEQAMRRGVTEIGISEHCHRFREFAPVLQSLADGSDAFPEVRRFLAHAFIDDLSDYADFILRMKEKGYPVKLGLEVDYVIDQEAALSAALQGYPWDYLLGSVHFLGKWAFDMSPKVGWPERDVDAVYTQYFATWERACTTGLFSSMSHPDLVKKFGHRPHASPHAHYASAAKAAARAGVAVEVSSAGLRKPVQEVYPDLELLQAFRQAGVPITLGSDAHSAEDVGLGLSAAAAWAQQAGYTMLSRFNQRQGELVRLA